MQVVAAQSAVLDLVTGLDRVSRCQGVDWARIAARVGQRNVATTANTYTHALLDPREANWSALLARVRGVHTPVRTF